MRSSSSIADEVEIELADVLVAIASGGGVLVFARESCCFFFLLRAFVPLCEIHWRSVWFWRGCVLARYGRGPTRLALLLFLGYIVCVTVILKKFFVHLFAPDENAPELKEFAKFNPLPKR